MFLVEFLNKAKVLDQALQLRDSMCVISGCHYDTLKLNKTNDDKIAALKLQ